MNRASRIALAFTLAVATASSACSGGRPPPPKNLPLPITSTTVGPGDKLEIYVVGEKDWSSHEYSVQPDGTTGYPYTEGLIVTGKEPQEIAQLVKVRLAEKEIYPHAQVSVVVKEYRSKRVSIIGQVTKPGNVAWNEGLKLVDAISQSGGFTPLADSNHVILTRTGVDKKTVTVVISVDAITDGQQNDIPLQAGDTIKVEQRVF